MSPQRIQRKRTKGWRMPEGAVNVTRPSGWSNPYIVHRTIRLFLDNGDQLPAIYVTRELAVQLFRAYVVGREYADQIREELAGKDLACWCPLDQPCHADVLLEIANGGAS